jgi:hypothetical protein
MLLELHDPSSLHPTQLGVKTPGGVEPLCQWLEDNIRAHLAKAGELNTAQTEMFVTSLDLKNAFNSIYRKAVAKALGKYSKKLLPAGRWLYGKPTPLVAHDGSVTLIIMSEEGVRQGDPLGPLFFSLALRDSYESFLCLIKQAHVDASITPPAVLGASMYAYLDDMNALTALPRATVLTAARKVFAGRGSKSGLVLNEQKTGHDSMTQINTRGIKVLGSFSGPLHARRTFLEAKIEKAAAGLEALKYLPSHQHALIVLKLSMATNLRHLLRSMDTEDMLDLWEKHDENIRRQIRWLRGSPNREGTWDKEIFALPVRFGGVGAANHGMIQKEARAASSEAARQTYEKLADLAEATPDEATDIRHQHQRRPVPQKIRCESLYQALADKLALSLEPQDQLQFVDNMGQFAGSWMHGIPGANKYHTFSNDTVETALLSRSLITSFQAEHCPQCSHVARAGHEEVCQHGKDNKAIRHTMVLKAIESTLKHDGHTVHHEQRFSTSTSARSDFRLTRATSARGALVPRADVHHDLSIVSLASKAVVNAASKLKLTEISADQTVVDVLKAHIQDKPLKKRAQDKDTAYAALNNNANTKELCVPVLLTTGGTLHKQFVTLLSSLKPYNRRFLAIRISGLLQQARHGSRVAVDRWTARMA